MRKISEEAVIHGRTVNHKFIVKDNKLVAEDKIHD